MRTIVAGLLFAALLQFSCPATAATDDSFEINVITPATGSGAFLGKSYKETFGALEVAINRSGAFGASALPSY